MDEHNLFNPDPDARVIQNIIKFKTLKEGVYYFLRDAIIKQQIKPNERLQEKDVAKQFGISTTPVREAFLKLHAEGYLNFEAHRSVTAKSLSHSELIEIYQVISVLDGFAASLALKKMDQKSLREIKNNTNEMEGFYKKGMIEEYLKMNTLIHSLIWEVAGNIHLNTTLNNIQNQMLRYQKERLFFYSKPDILKKSIGSHKKILKAFITSNCKDIEQIVRNHWNISGVISDIASDAKGRRK